MATMLDQVWGMVQESTFNTPATVTRFYARTDDTKHEWDNRRRMGTGLVAGGRRTSLGSRTYVPTGIGTITVKLPVEDKSFGYLATAAFGVGSVAVITGGAQQTFTEAVTGTVLPSYTIQFQDVMNNGTVVTTTYSGCTASKVALEQGNETELTLTVTFDAVSRSTSIGAATKAYTLGTIFDSYQATVGLGGTLTAPTTTTLASGLTAFADMRSWKLDIDQKISINRWNLNGGVRLQPVAGMPDVKWSGEIEWNATTWPVALVAGSILPWYVTYTTTNSLGAGFTTLQVAVPQLAVTKGTQEPKMDGSVATFPIEATVTNDGSHPDFWVLYQSTDVAA